MPRTASGIDTIRLLTALGRALGSNVAVTPRPGRPPKAVTAQQALTELLDGVPETPTRRRRRKLQANPQSLRRRLLRAATLEEVRRVLADIHAAQHSPANRFAPKWNEATIRRYLPQKFKDIDLA